MKPVPMITGDISQINWTRLALILVGFYAFIIVMYALGVAILGWGLIRVVGVFITFSAIAGILTGRLNLNVFLILLIFGGFLAVVNPAQSFTAGQIVPDLGLRSIPLFAGGSVLFEGDDNHVD